MHKVHFMGVQLLKNSSKEHYNFYIAHYFRALLMSLSGFLHHYVFLLTPSSSQQSLLLGLNPPIMNF